MQYPGEFVFAVVGQTSVIERHVAAKSGNAYLIDLTRVEIGSPALFTITVYPNNTVATTPTSLPSEIATVEKTSSSKYVITVANAVITVSFYSPGLQTIEITVTDADPRYCHCYFGII